MQGNPLNLAALAIHPDATIRRHAIAIIKRLPLFTVPSRTASKSRQKAQKLSA